MDAVPSERYMYMLLPSQRPRERVLQGKSSEYANTLALGKGKPFIKNSAAGCGLSPYILGAVQWQGPYQDLPWMLTWHGAHSCVWLWGVGAAHRGSVLLETEFMNTGSV